jgi:transcriptional regulator with XRE-family HTH domain/quinol monooxygenase YgiN
MFALVVRFDLAAGVGPAFDELVDETLGLIRAREPRTVVYACHQVEGAPDSRIFHELYEDRAALRRARVGRRARSTVPSGARPVPGRTAPRGVPGASGSLPARDGRCHGGGPWIARSPSASIAAYRRRRGLSQVKLANLVVRSENWLSQIERGERPIQRLGPLAELARVLDVPMTELIGTEPRAMRDRAEQHAAVEQIRLALSGSTSSRCSWSPGKPRRYVVRRSASWPLTSPAHGSWYTRDSTPSSLRCSQTCCSRESRRPGRSLECPKVMARIDWPPLVVPVVCR